MKTDSNLLEIISKNLFENNKEELKFINNKLECVCLNTNYQEKNKFSIFIERIIKNTNKEIAKNLDFIIVTNNNLTITEIDKIKEIFKKVEIINLKLNKEEDVYVQHEKEKEFIKNNKIPKYGIKSGPNLLFFKSIKILKNYNTSLLLETDCFLSQDWIEKIISYTENSNGFLISGATYDGSVHSTDPTMNSHINGVALYATGSAIFQSVMEHFEEYLIESIKNCPNLAYDWAFKIFLDKNLQKKENHYFWKFINRNYVCNKFIINCCLRQDKYLCDKKLMDLYNYAILHKK